MIPPGLKFAELSETLPCVFSTVFSISPDMAAETLSGELSDAFRLRVGDYRVLFSVEGTEMSIHGVRHRSDAYR